MGLMIIKVPKQVIDTHLISFSGDLAAVSPMAAKATIPAMGAAVRKLSGHGN